MSVRTAHILDQKWRSDDIKIGEDADFSSLLLPEKILAGLTAAGFKYPSPIQLKAIPVGKIGKDLIVQAKSGTGKTLVFSVVALNMLLKEAKHPQVLIMAPTREITCQISRVIQSISYRGVKCQYFIGGYRIEEDISRIEGCQIIVGTPGRIKQLINYKILKTGGIRLFVLDEADELLESSSFISDIDAIFCTLPRDKQMIATSATYSKKLKKLIEKYFRDPLVIRLNANDLSLLGMVHYYRVIPVSKMPVIAYKQKLKFLENVLLNVKFAQCLVFCNMVTRVENLCVEIKRLGFASTFLCSAIDQSSRLKAIENLIKFKCKVLVSSDLTARGIDAENVDLVINFDLPFSLETYLHRVGRAGRYGAKCVSVTFITSDEIEAYQNMQTEGKFESYHLPDCVPTNLINIVPKKKTCVKDEDLSLHNRQGSSSDLNDDLKELDENGSVKLDQSNNFLELHGNNNNELTSNSTIPEDTPENLANLADEKLVVSELASNESKSHVIQSQSLNLNSDSTSSVKGYLSNTSNSMELESDKNCSSTSIESTQEETVIEVIPSQEILELSEELSKSMIKDSAGKGSDNNDELVEGKSDEQTTSLVEGNLEDSDKNDNLIGSKSDKQNTSILAECHPSEESDKNDDKLVGSKSDEQHTSMLAECNSEKCQSKFDIHGEAENPENDSEKPKKEQTNDDQSLTTDNKCNISEISGNSKSDTFVSSIMSFTKQFEQQANDNSSETCFMSDSTNLCPSSDVKAIDDELSALSLKCMRLKLNQFYYKVSKDFIKDIPNNYIDELSQRWEVEDQQCLKQDDNENKDQDSGTETNVLICSASEIKTPSAIRSSHSSCPDSSTPMSYEGNTQVTNKVKPADKIPKFKNGSNCDSDSNASVNSADAMYTFVKEFNKMEGDNFIKNGESYSSSSSYSESGSSLENDYAKLNKELNKILQGERPKSCSEDIKVTKEKIHAIKGNKKCYKGIEIVDNKMLAKSSSNISSSSDSDTTSDDEETKNEPKKKFDHSSDSASDAEKSKMKLNEKLASNTTKRTSYQKQRTISRPGKNKITYYYSGTSSSETESDVAGSDSDKEKAKHESKIELNEKIACNTTKRASHQKQMTISRPGRNKITYYYSGTSSETESDVDGYSEESYSRHQVGCSRKRGTHKKGSTPSKPGLSQFSCSSANGRYSNPRPYFNSTHYSSQTQPRYASDPYNHLHPQQSQDHGSQRPFAHSSYPMQPVCSSNAFNSHPYYQRQSQNPAEQGSFLPSQFNYPMQQTYAPYPQYQPYPSECPLKECCQMNRMQPRSGTPEKEHSACASTNNFNAHRKMKTSTNHAQPNYDCIQPPCCASNQCCVPSGHPSHPPNEICQSPACAGWYDMFYKQWQLLSQSSYF